MLGAIPREFRKFEQLFGTFQFSFMLLILPVCESTI